MIQAFNKIYERTVFVSVDIEIASIPALYEWIHDTAVSKKSIEAEVLYQQWQNVLGADTLETFV